jgi:hypothetical protein
VPNPDRADNTAERFYRGVVAYLHAVVGLRPQANSGPPLLGCDVLPASVEDSEGTDGRQR